MSILAYTEAVNNTINCIVVRAGKAAKLDYRSQSISVTMITRPRETVSNPFITGS